MRHRPLMPCLLGAAALLSLAGCAGDTAETDGSPPTSAAPTSPSTTASTSSPSTSSPSTSSTSMSSTSTSSTSTPSSSTPATAGPVDGVTTTSDLPITGAPVTAASIAAEIVAAERGIRDTSLSADAVAEFGRRQQRAYQLLARNADLYDEVSSSLPADVAAAFAFNGAARQAVADHAAGKPPSEPSVTLPAWTILEPLTIDELLAHYSGAESATGVPWEYLAAINLVETRMGRISGESSAGALGPMQFLPGTWAACCTGDIHDPQDAILGAAVYLVSEGAPGDMHAALYGYNPNEGYVGAVTAYAANLMADPLAYRGYHAWEVYVGSAAGTVRLPVGFSASEPVDATEYVRTHPDDAR